MARTAKMQLIELLVMKDDVGSVIEYLGNQGNFEFQSDPSQKQPLESNTAKEVFDKLQFARAYLNIPELTGLIAGTGFPTEKDYSDAQKLLAVTEAIHQKELEFEEAHKRVQESVTEAQAFSNLQVPFSELDRLSFLSIRIGKIDPKLFGDLQFSIGDRAVVIPLGDDKSRIMAVSSKKGRFSLDTELKRVGFSPIEISKDFKGIPDDMLDNLKTKLAENAQALENIVKERANFTETHTEIFRRLLSSFAIGAQITATRQGLESTQLVYRIIGWIPAVDSATMVKGIDDLAEGRVAIRLYNPGEIPAVKDGREQVPVKLAHGKFVGSFERMILSYGTPLYGTIDPTPIIAVFFMLLFGVMFGDAGQGLVFVLVGILMNKGVLNKIAGAWCKFAPIFIAIGCTSTVMGFLNGEFFANHEILHPLGSAVAGLFGLEYPFLHLGPGEGSWLGKDSIHKLFAFLGFTVGIGFIINSVGLVINIANQFSLKRYGKALFGKTGLSGALFFWYIVATVIRIFAFKIPMQTFDWIVIVVTLSGVFFAEPLERLVEGHRPVFENGIGTGMIHGVVELLEIMSSYLSSSVSFLRVGAFALAHAVLGFIIFTMTELVGGAPGILVSILGNGIVIVLEGMIVAIQVVRLQYYEFFSKFFTETGKEFIPYKFKYSKEK
jgi:V/A-type H+-transporting ATPase subunit I